MRFPLTPDEEEFRQRVRAFCAENLPRSLAKKVRANVELDREDYVGWQKRLAKGGLLCGAWAREDGGQDWSALQSYLFDEECALAGAPWLLPFGVNYVGPVLCKYGTPEQKRRYLPGILSADTFWCQGYSEPEAGSDLASLRTRAALTGDHYRVTGRKIWTTMAHWADRMFCLVRTSIAGKPQAGISFMLIDMKAPGVSVRPIISIEGRPHLNEVLLEDVRVPLEDRVGEENAGWTIAKYLLSNERLLVAEIGKQKRLLAAARFLLGEASIDAREGLAALDVRLAALEWTALRTVREASVGSPSAAAVSMLKIRGSELEQAITEFAVEAMGEAALAYDSNLESKDETALMRNGMIAQMLSSRAATIYGGSNEIQRNIIAKSIVGL
ncbi:acyl-CoA dehydrogenase family protein [Terrarubrum flagellatum]|uniref:acyl-CoA dehydrogenase family protein n=1 Tax=Terrirubrum flagellatum TaxID=2895980 RepID=UPI0031454F81